MDATIEVRNAALTYQAPEGEVRAVEDVSFRVMPGEFVSIVGPSGCGKTSLLSAIAGLEKLSAGEIVICGEPAAAPARHIGLMPQRDQLFPWWNIRRNVSLGLRIQKMDDAAHRRQVQELLERYDLAAFADKKPGQLSGGMRQRCALIRTLATNPEILLLDEPFSALDYQTRLQVSCDIFRIIRAENKTALLVTHDISEAISLSDRIVVLSGRPAQVKTIVDVGALRELMPMERRENAAFSGLFDVIWKELDIRDEP